MNQLVRVILSFWFLFYTSLPLFIKIIIIEVLDFTDISFPIFLDMNRESENLFTPYQEFDKIGDIIIYTGLWYYYIFFLPSPTVFKTYITLLFVYRWIGYLIYLHTKKEIVFVYFPNFFLESLFVLSVLQETGFSYPKYKPLYYFLLGTVLLIKLIQEIYVHTNWLSN